jgi:hypothetical protein
MDRKDEIIELIKKKHDGVAGIGRARQKAMGGKRRHRRFLSGLRYEVGDSGVKALGRGGLLMVFLATGMPHNTVARGGKEIEERLETGGKVSKRYPAVSVPITALRHSQPFNPSFRQSTNII